MASEQDRGQAQNHQPDEIDVEGRIERQRAQFQHEPIIAYAAIGEKSAWGESRSLKAAQVAEDDDA
jgi:hypothetical protein